MKKWKSNLDEMQEQELAKLESRTCWLAYWLLVAVILVQMLLSDSFESILGETVVLLILCIYLVVGCLRLGIWDRRMKASRKTNLLVSIIPGFVVGLVTVVRSLHNYGYTNFVATAATFLLPFVFTYLLTFALLSLSTAIYRKRKEKLENE